MPNNGFCEIVNFQFYGKVEGNTDSVYIGESENVKEDMDICKL